MSSADQLTFLVAGGHRRHRPRLAVDMGLHDLLGLLRVAEEHTRIQAHEPSQGFKLARSGPWGSTEQRYTPISYPRGKPKEAQVWRV